MFDNKKFSGSSSYIDFHYYSSGKSELFTKAIIGSTNLRAHCLLQTSPRTLISPNEKSIVTNLLPSGNALFPGASESIDLQLSQRSICNLLTKKNPHNIQ
jgi:hypothetical protein